MEQVEMFPLDHKGIPGTKWWAGNWECRNHHGYFQSRESGQGNWQFQIISFGDYDCDIYAVNKDAKLVPINVPIDNKDRITVLGRKYGRRFWAH